MNNKKVYHSKNPEASIFRGKNLCQMGINTLTFFLGSAAHVNYKSHIELNFYALK